MTAKQPFNFPAYIKFETAKDAKAAIETLRSLYADRCSHVALRKGDNRKVVSFNCANAESAKAIGFLFRHAEYVGYATTAEEREAALMEPKEIKEKLTLKNRAWLIGIRGGHNRILRYSESISWNEVVRLAYAEGFTATRGDAPRSAILKKAIVSRP